MNTSNHTIIRRLLPGLILGFVVLIGLAFAGGLREVSQSLLSFRWEYFLIALALTLLNYTLRFFKWHYYLNQIGVRDLSLAPEFTPFYCWFSTCRNPR